MCKLFILFCSADWVYPQRGRQCRSMLPACSCLQELLDFLGTAGMLTMDGDKGSTSLRRRLITSYLLKAGGRGAFYNTLGTTWWAKVNHSKISYMIDLFSILSSSHHSNLHCAAQRFISRAKGHYSLKCLTHFKIRGIHQPVHRCHQNEIFSSPQQ